MSKPVGTVKIELSKGHPVTPHQSSLARIAFWLLVALLFGAAALVLEGQEHARKGYNTKLSYSEADLIRCALLNFDSVCHDTKSKRLDLGSGSAS